MGDVNKLRNTHTERRWATRRCVMIRKLDDWLTIIDYTLRNTIKNIVLCVLYVAFIRPALAKNLPTRKWRVRL